MGTGDEVIWKEVLGIHKGWEKKFGAEARDKILFKKTA